MQFNDKGQRVYDFNNPEDKAEVNKIIEEDRIALSEKSGNTSIYINAKSHAEEIDQLKLQVSALQKQLYTGNGAGSGNAPIGNQGLKEQGLEHNFKNRKYSSNQEMISDIYRMKHSSNHEEKEFANNVISGLWKQNLDSVKRSNQTVSMEFDGNIRQVRDSLNEEVRKNALGGRA